MMHSTTHYLMEFETNLCFQEAVPEEKVPSEYQGDTWDKHSELPPG